MSKCVISNNAPTGILRTFNHNKYVKLYYQGNFTKTGMLGAIKKTHKQRHNRKLNTLWFKIYEKQWMEYCEQFEIVFDNGRVLFVKKGENK